MTIIRILSFAMVLGLFLGTANAKSDNGNSNGVNNGNPTSNGDLNNGQTGCKNGCEGNSGKGVGNTGAGNQGNTGDNGNAAGAVTGGGNSEGGNSSAGGNNAGGTSGNGDNNNGQTGCKNGCFGNNGNGVGNTGAGNQGNEGSNGNAGGSKDGGNNGGDGGNNGGDGGNNGGGNNGGDGGNNGDDNNGQTGCKNGCGGNNGNGSGNTGPGNQGNGGDNGNAGGGNNGGGDDPGTDNPGTDNPGTDNPGTDNPGTDNPGTDNPGTDNPGTEKPNTENPDTGKPDTETPDKEKPGTEKPGTETPDKEKPGTEKPDTEQPSDEKNDDDQPKEDKKEEKEESTSSNDKKDREFKVKLRPIGYGYYDLMDMAVNLTGFREGQKISNDSRISFVLDEYRDGFNVTHVRNYSGGLGVSLVGYFTNTSGFLSTFAAVVGVMPVKDMDIVSNRYLETEEEVEEKGRLPIPYSATDLNEFNVGDSIMYHTRGGVMFTTGAALAGGYAGKLKVTEGGWLTNASKVGEDQVVLEVNNTDITKTSTFKGMLLVNDNDSDITEVYEGFTYKFDFSTRSPYVVEAYESMIRGNMEPAQRMSAEFNSGVVKVNKTDTVLTTKSRNLFIGVPMVLSYQSNNSDTFKTQNVLTHANGAKSIQDYSIYVDAKRTRFFHKHKNQTLGFYSGMSETKSSEGKIISSDVGGYYTWKYENDWGKTHKLKKAITEMMSDLGLSKDFKVEFPDREKLKFIRVEAGLELDEKFTNEMLSSENAFLASAMEANMDQLIGEYFSKSKFIGSYFEDSDRLCRLMDPTDTDRNESPEKCQRRIQSESDKAMRIIKQNIKKMKTAQNRRSKDSKKDFLEAYTNVGKQLMTNQFVFKAFSTIDQACRLNLNIKVEGRRINRTYRSIPANPNCR